MRILTIAVATVLLVSFASEASARICPRNRNFPLIEKGMTLQEVTRLIGKPVSAESGPADSKVLFYCLSSSFLDSDGSDTREYWVQMMQGKVIGYGERVDAATFQRAQRQHVSAWASANMIVDSANQAANRLTHPSSPAVTTHVNIHGNRVLQRIEPPAEVDGEAEQQAKPDWRKWNP